jgi:hypothetical protein
MKKRQQGHGYAQGEQGIFAHLAGVAPKYAHGCQHGGGCPGQCCGAAQLAQRCDPIVGGWIEKIAVLVNDPAISTPAELAGRLVEMYGGLPSDELSKIMQIADLTAQLSGRFDVINEAGGGA